MWRQHVSKVEGEVPQKKVVVIFPTLHEIEQGESKHGNSKARESLSPSNFQPIFFHVKQRVSKDGNNFDPKLGKNGYTLIKKNVLSVGILIVAFNKLIV